MFPADSIGLVCVCIFDLKTVMYRVPKLKCMWFYELFPHMPDSDETSFQICI